MGMLDFVIGLAVVLLIVAIPQLRRATLSMLGLLAIVGFGSSVFGAAVWMVYESKQWLADDGSDQETQVPIPLEGGGADPRVVPTDHFTAALAREEALWQEEVQQVLEEKRLIQEQERQRIVALATRARAILEEDRKLARYRADHPLPVAIDGVLADILAIRIPPWRDRELAGVQQESIRTWLVAIGLTADETAHIVTAKAWGGLYDLWIAENPQQAPPDPAAAILTPP